MEAKKMNWIKRSVALVLALLVAITFLPFSGFNLVTAKADVGETPEHGKTATENGDGTYKLELSVTGDAETEVETAANVNVLIVYDESSSMTSNNVTTNPNRNRADYAEDVMHDFVVSLRGYQTGDGSNIQAAVVGFGPTATTRQTWTSDLADTGQGLNRLFDDGVDGTITTTHNYSNNNGTNWEAALRQAQTLLTSADDDPTFVILMTDGACTASGNGNNAINPAGNHPWTDFRQFYIAATDEARAIQNRTDTTLFGIYAYGREADLLDDLIYYSNNGSHRVINGYNIQNCTAQQHNFGATEITDNYFNAADTAALNAAIESIFQQIVQALGVSSAAISDGTTHEVATSSGNIELLEVIEEYQYWLTVPIENDNTFQRVDLVSGETITYTVSSDGSTVTWDSNSVTVNGEIISEGGKRYLKYEWTGANALYNYDPPEAKLNGSSVDWNLSSVGTLLDGVKYSVTFDVYPSQTTLDYVSDIDNGLYDTLPDEVKDYIDEDGKLETNTTATLTWKDTRNDPATSGSATYTNPEPVESNAVEQLAVAKKWTNDIDSQSSAPINLIVTRDGEPHDPELTLSSDNEWKGSIYISIGIMRTHNDEMQVLAEGHDFSFVEPEDIGYRWELDVPTVHPMLIDGELTMLIKVDAAHPAPSGADTYEIGGATYYADEAEEASLTATNYRRSQLVLTKEVDGEGYPEDATFPFTLSVTNSKASEGTEGDLNSDYYVWFTTIDDNGDNTDDVTVTGATKEDGAVGWYHVASGASFSVNLPAGYSVRFINLPKDSTYEFEEGTLASGFRFIEAELTAGEDDEFEGGVTSTGTIVDWNTEYEVTYTNEYALVDVTVDKFWDDASDQDGIRPDELELKLNGLPTGTTAPEPEITGTDGNTWTYKWSGLPKYDADGEAITYTVSEETVPDEYTKSPADPVGDKETITNTHTPETTSISVEKVWDDNNNQDDVRPGSVTVQLKADGENYGDPVELSDDNEWTYTWPNLPVKASGEDIEYTITEDPVTDYSPKYSGPVQTDDGLAFTVTNTHTPAVTSITATKAWSDNNNQDGIRPNSVEFVLYKNGEATDTKITLDGTVDDQGETAAWTATFSDLPQKEGGQEITYTVSEDTVPEGYTKSPTDPVGNNGTITNTHTPETTTATITKAWADNDDQDGLRPTTLAVDLYKQVGEGERTKVQTYTLKESDQWTLTADNLPKYEEGREITYSWTETNVPADYTCAETTVANGRTITNTHTPETIDINVKKVWEDDEPDHDAIGVQLMVGEDVLDTQTLSDDNGWTYTWEDMPKYNAGQEIEYTVEEDEVPTGYISEISGSATEGFTITNKISSVIVDPPVQKIIEGNEDLYNKGDFTFTITNVSAEGPNGAIENVPMPTATSITNYPTWEKDGMPGFYEFGEIEFTEPGEYVYKVTESGKVDGVENDPESEKTITFTVTQNEDGSLSVDPTTDNAVFKFVNKYTKEPETGDHSNMTFWMIAMIIAGLGIIGLTVFRLRKKENEGK